ncbi:MAG: VanW family protein [Clostridia bacterium]|nr:VanW family protein [Clostridia bacterium]
MKDAYIEKNPLKVYSNVDGVDFAISIDEAKKFLEEIREEYIIPLKITKANKTIYDLGEDIFVEEISKFTTKYDTGNKERSTNLELASNKINGIIIKPNEEFSYNKAVGKRTLQGGYKEAAIYANGQIEQGVGGGICQISSTLYNAALLANLQITSRQNHYFKPSYASEGRDATVSWGTIDFKFKNNRTYPIKISSETKNGVVIISILGIKEDTEYQILIQSEILSVIPYETKYIEDNDVDKETAVIEQRGENGTITETYRVLKNGGNIISKELISRDVYNAIPEIIKVSNKI